MLAMPKAACSDVRRVRRSTAHRAVMDVSASARRALTRTMPLTRLRSTPPTPPQLTLPPLPPLLSLTSPAMPLLLPLLASPPVPVLCALLLPLVPVALLLLTHLPLLRCDDGLTAP